MHAGEQIVVDEALVKAIGDALWPAVVAGFGADLDDLSPESPDYLVLQNLRANTFYFSAAKTVQQLLLANELLIDPATGELRTLSEFKKLINEQINTIYNEQYLRTEYNLAIASAQSARQWQDDMALSETHYAQYKTVGDGRVREKHQRLDGITLPLTDPFWQMANPPNAYGCRCFRVMVPREGNRKSNSARARRLGTDALTELDGNGNNRLAMFQFNPGTTQMVYPPGHPYFNLPDGGEDAARQAGEQAAGL